MKKFIALLLAAIMTLSLAACGGSSDDEKNTNDGSESSAGADLDWSKGADASGGDVTLRVTSWRQYDEETYEEIIKRFEEKYDWIDVELEITPSSSSYYSNLQADYISGDAPDVMDLHRNYMMEYAKEGMIAPQTNFDYQEVYKEVAKENTNYEGECYGFMLAYNYFGFVYNIDVFNKVGVSIPTTPEEMVDVINKLKNAGYGGIAYAGSTIGSKLGRNILEITLGMEGTQKLLKGIDDGSITDISTMEGTESAFNTIQYYVDNEILYNAYEGISYESAVSLFAQEKSAILYSGTYSLGEAQKTFPNINFGYFAIPTYSGNSLNPAEPAQNACINSSCENLGAAKLWVEFLATPEISAYFCANSKMLSTIEGVSQDDEIIKMVLDSSESFVITPSDPKNGEYWEYAYEQVFDNVMLKGANWKDEVRKLSNKLEDYDLSSLQ